MRLFKCIVNDGDDIIKAYATGKTKKDILNIYGGNGEFIKVVDVTELHLEQNSLKLLENDLLNTGWGEAERTIILALLQQHIDSRK